MNANQSSDLIWVSGGGNKENPLHTPESTGRDELRFLTAMPSVLQLKCPTVITVFDKANIKVINENAGEIHLALTRASFRVSITSFVSSL